MIIIFLFSGTFARFKAFARDSVSGNSTSRVHLSQLHVVVGNSFLTSAKNTATDWNRNFQILQYLFFISAMDLDVRKGIERNHSAVLDDYFQLVNYLGDKRNALVAAAFGGVSFIAGYEEGQEIGVELLSTYGIASLFTHTIKNLSGRRRPYVAESQYEFSGPGVQGFKTRSFPSGHATIAFATATVLNHHIDNRWIKAGIWFLAGSTSLGRVYKEKHWFSDVVAGSIIGYMTGKVVTKVTAKMRFAFSQK